MSQMLLKIYSLVMLNVFINEFCCCLDNIELRSKLEQIEDDILIEDKRYWYKK